MTDCRVELLSLSESREAASEVAMIPAFADLNIFRVILQRPKTAKALSYLLVSLLFGGELDDRLRELLIMRIGWSTGSNYEWTQHWKIALEQFGCSEQDLLELRGEWQQSDHYSDTDRVLLRAVDTLLAEGTLSKELTEECMEQFGPNATIELVAAVGCWQMVSKLARTLEIPLEEGIASWPPDGVPPRTDPGAGAPA